jgi:hypothetical protein
LQQLLKPVLLFKHIALQSTAIFHLVQSDVVVTDPIRQHAVRSCYLHTIHVSQGFVQGFVAPVDLSGYDLIHSGDMTGNMTMGDMPFVL